MTSCANTPEKPDEPGTKQQTTDLETTDSETTDDPTGTQPDETTNKEPLSINTDLFDEYMMTYGELSEKHGKLIGYERRYGSDCYLFENGQGYYAFYLEEPSINYLTDPNTKIKYRTIDDDEVCRGIYNISAELLFEESFDTLSIESIANIDGLRYVETVKDGRTNSKAFASSFILEGLENDKLYLVLYHDDKDMIDLTSEGSIYIHNIDVDINTDQYHRHGALHTYDENTKKVYGVYKGNLIQFMIMDIQTWSGDGVRVFADGVEVFEGELREGMIVKIYHEGVLYGEYEIAELLEPYPQP